MGWSLHIEIGHEQTLTVCYCLLLSSFVCCHVRLKVSRLTFAIENFRPYSSEFVSEHVTAAVQLKAALSLQQKSYVKKKGKQIRYTKKRKQTENGKTPGSEQPVVKSICGSLTMR